jgi:hypothetical protein
MLQNGVPESDIDELVEKARAAEQRSNDDID